MVRDVGHDELSNEDRAAPPESMRKLVEKPDGRGLARQLDDPLSLRAQFRTCFGLGGFIGATQGESLLRRIDLVLGEGAKYLTNTPNLCN